MLTTQSSRTNSTIIMAGCIFMCHSLEMSLNFDALKSIGQIEICLIRQLHHKLEVSVH